MYKHPYSTIESYNDIDGMAIKKIAMNYSIYQAQGAGWVEQARANKPYVTKWVSELYSKKNKGVAVVVASGPSFFSRILDVVKEYPNATYFVVDRSCDAALHYKIPMHYVVCQDSGKVVSEYIHHLPKNITTILGIFSHEDTVRKVVETECEYYWSGPCNPFSPTAIAINDMYGSESATAMEGCLVTFSTVDIAVQMGFSKVIIVGNDMKYSTLSEAFAGGKDIATELNDNTYSIETFNVATQSFKSLPNMYPNVEFIDYSGHRIADGSISKTRLDNWIQR